TTAGNRLLRCPACAAQAALGAAPAAGPAYSAALRARLGTHTAAGHFARLRRAIADQGVVALVSPLCDVGVPNTSRRQNFFLALPAASLGRLRGLLPTGSSRPPPSPAPAAASESPAARAAAPGRCPFSTCRAFPNS